MIRRSDPPKQSHSGPQKGFFRRVWTKVKGCLCGCNCCKGELDSGEEINGVAPRNHASAAHTDWVGNGQANRSNVIQNEKNITVSSPAGVGARERSNARRETASTIRAHPTPENDHKNADSNDISPSIAVEEWANSSEKETSATEGHRKLANDLHDAVIYPESQADQYHSMGTPDSKVEKSGALPRAAAREQSPRGQDDIGQKDEPFSVEDERNYTSFPTGVGEGNGDTVSSIDTRGQLNIPETDTWTMGARHSSASEYEVTEEGIGYYSSTNARLAPEPVPLKNVPGKNHLEGSKLQYEAFLRTLQAHREALEDRHHNGFKEAVETVCAQSGDNQASILPTIQYYTSRTLTPDQMVTEALLAYVWFFKWTQIGPPAFEEILEYARRVGSTRLEAECLVSMSSFNFPMDQKEQFLTKASKLFGALEDLPRSIKAELQSMYWLAARTPQGTGNGEVVKTRLSEVRRKWRNDLARQTDPSLNAEIDLLSNNILIKLPGADFNLQEVMAAEKVFTDQERLYDVARCASSLAHGFAAQNKYSVALEAIDVAIANYYDAQQQSGPRGLERFVPSLHELQAEVIRKRDHRTSG